MKEDQQEIKSGTAPSINPEQRQKLDAFRAELLSWNEQMNLTAITDPKDMEIKHFEDSISALLAVKPETKTLIDVGTGAGFPGIPIAIMRPDIQVTLVESVAKKASFLQHVIETLEIKNCSVANARAEEVGQHPDYREKYDAAIARAVALLPVLAEYLLPLVKVGGVAIAQKSLRELENEPGTIDESEIKSAEGSIATLGGKIKEIIPVTLSDGTKNRRLIVIEKISSTGKEYPRRPGMPAKTPLL